MRARRKVLGVSQEAIAHKAELSLNLVNKIERGVITDPHISTLVALADALEVSVSALVGEDFLRAEEATLALPKAKAPEAGQPEGASTRSRAEGHLNFYGRLEDLSEEQTREFLAGILEGRITVEEVRERLATTGSETA
jgi:transcriptional regulator with XRE-family HTH domain